MRILFLVSHLRKGGVTNVLYNLCCQLKKNSECEISIVTLREEEKSSRYDDFLNLGICITQMHSSYIKCELFSSLISKKIQSIIDTQKIDIVHCHGYHPVLVGANLQKVKIVATLHNRASEDFVNVFGTLWGKRMLHKYLCALKNFDVCSAVSQSAAKLYFQLGLHNISFVNNGIDTDGFIPVSNEVRSQLREKYHLPLDQKIIVSSGRIEKEKRYVEMIHYFVSFLGKEPITLIILGDGSQLKTCKEIAKDDEHVVFTGLVKDVKEYLQCADYYISYSVSEGMSMAVCEAVSCGLYPILSDIPSHHDVADALLAEKNAMIYNEVEDVGAHFKELPTAIEKTKLHNYIDNNFSIKTMENGYLNIYKKVFN